MGRAGRLCGLVESSAEAPTKALEAARDGALRSVLAAAEVGSDATGQVDVMAREGSTNFFNAKEASFCFIKPDNPLRVTIFRLCDHQMFDNVIMFDWDLQVCPHRPST